MAAKTAFRWLLTAFAVIAGANHFVDPELYLAMIPDALPAPALINALAGLAEIAGGLGLAFRRTRRAAAWGLIALLVAVFPANLNMAIHELPLGGRDVPAWALWARLPLQGLFILWAYWFTRPDPVAGRRASK